MILLMKTEVMCCYIAWSQTYELMYLSVCVIILTP